MGLKVAIVFFSSLLLSSTVLAIGPCLFPFTFNGTTHDKCVHDIRVTRRPVCLTAQNEERECFDQPPGAASQTESCHFPFLFANRTFKECAVNTNGVTWCCTNYDCDTDPQWTSCRIEPVGEKGTGLCVFPFTFKGTRYHECVSDDYEGKPWCSLTANYDKDKRWRDCQDANALDICNKPGNATTGQKGQIFTLFNHPHEYEKIVCSLSVQAAAFQSIRLEFPFMDVGETCSRDAAHNPGNEVEVQRMSLSAHVDLCAPNGAQMHTVYEDTGSAPGYLIVNFHLRNHNFRGFVMNYEVIQGCSTSLLAHHDFTHYTVKNLTHVEYLCAYGYKLRDERSKVIVCDVKTGQWSAPPGECVEITCPLPKTINTLAWKHDSTTDHFTVGDKVIFVCGENHTLWGNDTWICTKQGRWMGTEPACVPKVIYDNTPATASLLTGIICAVVILILIVLVTFILTRSNVGQSLFDRFTDRRGQHRPVLQNGNRDGVVQYRDIPDPNSELYRQHHSERPTKNGTGRRTHDMVLTLDSDSEAELVDNEVEA